MSNLVKYQIQEEVLKTGKADAQTASLYPEILEPYNDLYTKAKSFEAHAKELKKKFDEAKTDEEKLSFAKDAKTYRLEVMKTRTKKEGAEKVKAEFADQVKGYTATNYACFNVVESYAKGLEADMKSIEDHAETIRLREEKALRESRIEEVEIIGGLEFLAEGEDPAAYELENWEKRLFQIEEMAKLKKFKEDQEAQAEAERLRKEKEEADRKAKADKIRQIRGRQLHEVGAFYEGDLATLDEVEFSEVLEEKKTEYKAKLEAEAEAERLRKEEEAKEKERNTLRNKRMEALRQFGVFNTKTDPADWTAEEFANNLDMAEDHHKRNIKAQETEAIAKAKAEAQAEAERKAQAEAQAREKAKEDELYAYQREHLESCLHPLGRVIGKIESSMEDEIQKITHPQAVADANKILELLEKAYNFYGS